MTIFEFCIVSSLSLFTPPSLEQRWSSASLLSADSPSPRCSQVFTALHHIAHASAEYSLLDTPKSGTPVPLSGCCPIIVIADQPTCILAPERVPWSRSAVSKSLGITVIAGWGNFDASPPSIECVIGPFDF